MQAAFDFVTRAHGPAAGDGDIDHEKWMVLHNELASRYTAVMTAMGVERRLKFTTSWPWRSKRCAK